MLHWEAGEHLIEILRVLLYNNTINSVHVPP